MDKNFPQLPLILLKVKPFPSLTQGKTKPNKTKKQIHMLSAKRNQEDKTRKQMTKSLNRKLPRLDKNI